MLHFFGSGSGFEEEHTSACFVTDEDELVIIDCPASTFQKLKKFDFSEYKDIYVLITHTHGDHIGGLGLFAQFGYFVAKKDITIVAPSEEVAKDIETILRIEGNELSWCTLITVAELEEKSWFGKAILTEHSPQLKNKCFGYLLYENGTNCVYTGDTSTLEPFIPYLKYGTWLYVDTSVYYGMIHLKLEDCLLDFQDLISCGVKIVLMHLDNIEAAADILDANGFRICDIDIAISDL